MKGFQVHWNSIGGVKVRSLWHLPRFFKLAMAAKRDALQTNGCVAVDLFRRGRVFHVLSVWNDPVAMKQFAQGDAHAAFMAERAVMFEFAHNMVFPTEAPATRDDATSAWVGRFTAT